MPIYILNVERFGEIKLDAGSKKEALARAVKMFSKMNLSVHPVRHYLWCERCESKPCCCERKS